ncbi:MAG TPA: ATP-binding protein [Candidatus Acidoferrales bacterium]|nr:ATP-binding protein [Candidatus Acidoferrales bacterium]
MNPPLTHHPMIPTNILLFWGVAAAALLGGAIFLVMLARKMIRSQSLEFRNDWARPKADQDNAPAFVAASMQGVIERLRAQEKELARLHMLAQERAQESERLTEEVTRNMPTGLLLVSATGTISSTNPAAEEALGMRPLRYRSYREILGEDSGLVEMLGACLRNGETFQRSEVEHVTPEGEVRRLGVTISPIFQAPRPALRTYVSDPPSKSVPKVSGALCLMSDLTELTALQKQIRWKENLAALGEMSAGIAHEFKNALATIAGYAQMIRSEAQAGEIFESAERILDQTRALTHVVTEFLRFAKPLEISYEMVPMQALLERVAQELRETAPQCEVICEGTFPDAPGDEALLRQALVNLTRNAAEAAAAGRQTPRVTISGSVEELGGKTWQRICVSDNGPGVAEHDLPKIFLPFYTTKSEGTGLGLAVVQKVALQHGGSIEARNRAGGGAEFLLWLPLRQERSASLFPSRTARI